MTRSGRGQWLQQWCLVHRLHTPAHLSCRMQPAKYLHALVGVQAAASAGDRHAPHQSKPPASKHKPARQQASHQLPARPPHKQASHSAPARKAPSTGPQHATPPAQITHAFLPLSSRSGQQLIGNAAFRSELLPQSFPDLAWQSPPAAKLSTDKLACSQWMQGPAFGQTAALCSSPEASAQQLQRGAEADSSPGSSSDEGSDQMEGLTPEAARAAAERSVSSLTA